MKTIYFSLFLLFLVHTDCYSQFTTEELFIGGSKGFNKLLNKSTRYLETDYDQGRYGLCLIKLTISRIDTLKNIEILSSPSKSISQECIRVIQITKPFWIFPSTFKDSVNALIGFYFIKNGNNTYNSKAKLPKLSYDDLYKEYEATNLFNKELTTFHTPFIFLGILTVIAYGSIAIE